jgi:hypothetical protein
LGNVYTCCGLTFQNSNIAYNWVHDAIPKGPREYEKAAAGNGIYLDNGTANMRVHHNVIWNVEDAVAINGAPWWPTWRTHNFVFNNTIGAGVARSSGCGLFEIPVMNNIFVNNIFSAPTLAPGNYTAGNVETLSIEEVLKDPIGPICKFAPLSNSVARGTGLNHQIKALLVGEENTTDAGAVQFSQTECAPGCNFDGC